MESKPRMSLAFKYRCVVKMSIDKMTKFMTIPFTSPGAVMAYGTDTIPPPIIVLTI